MMSTLWITSERGKHEIALTLSIYPEDRSVQICIILTLLIRNQQVCLSPLGT